MFMKLGILGLLLTVNSKQVGLCIKFIGVNRKTEQVLYVSKIVG